MKIIKTLLLCATALTLTACGNPIIGKWKATSGAEILKQIGCGELEFTSSKEYSCGMAEDVKYEIDGDKVLVTGTLGVSIVYHMQGKNQMYCEIFGEKIYWERLK